MVIGVARGAHDIVFCVLRPPDIGAIEVFRMAFETCVDDLRRLHDGEGMQDRVLAAARRDVILGGAMASLAGGELRRSLARGHALKVRVLVESGPYSWVAGLALRIAYISCVGRNHRENRPSFRRLAL